MWLKRRQCTECREAGLFKAFAVPFHPESETRASPPRTLGCSSSVTKETLAGVYGHIQSRRDVPEIGTLQVTGFQDC